MCVCVCVCVCVSLSVSLSVCVFVTSFPGLYLKDLVEFVQNLVDFFGLTVSSWDNSSDCF